MGSDAREMAAELLGGARGPDPARMRAICEAYLESWRAGSPDMRAQLFAADAVVEDPVGSPPLSGLDAVQAFWQQAESNGYVFDPRLELFIACGREALVRFEMGMVRPGEAPVALLIHEIVVFDADCRIVALRAFFSHEQFRPAGEAG